MSLEDEAFKLEDLRRRAAGLEAAPGWSERREPGPRGPMGWIAWALVVGLTAFLLGGFLQVLEIYGVDLAVPVALVGTVLLLHLLSAADERRRSRRRIEALEEAVLHLLEDRDAQVVEAGGKGPVGGGDRGDAGSA
ncbi:MAG: hypothetical protein ACPGQL_07575 [Thermoplasmatota archaeon]